MPADPSAVRALAERLIAIASVSPDVAGETRCARALIEALPPGIEHGTWPTTDGRPVVWARVRGKARRTLLLLGHYDTVGYDEFAALGAPSDATIAPSPGAAIALDPAALRELLTARGAVRDASPAVERDIEEEWRRPGTWMFGRGALDMKSGLAAGIAALGALAESAGALAGDVMFVATPDEENQSVGMRVAVEQLSRLERESASELIGVLNLDYVDAPVAYRGAMGKTRVGLWVLGRPGHAGQPFEAVDAAQIAAELVLTATLSARLADLRGSVTGPPPVALKLRDLKPRYDVQTAAEAVVELNVLTFSRHPEETLALARDLAMEAMRSVLLRRNTLRRSLEGSAAPAEGELTPRSFTLAELEHGVSWGVETVLREVLGGHSLGSREDGEAWTGRLRSLAARTRLSGPAVVACELPPHYPAVPPTDGPVSRAAEEVLAREGIERRFYYPFITDASLMAARAPAPPALSTPIESAIPAGRASGRPIDIVTLGPWGRDAHGLFERVNVRYAFERLPRLIADVARAALRG